MEAGKSMLVTFNYIYSIINATVPEVLWGELARGPWAGEEVQGQRLGMVKCIKQVETASDSVRGC